MPKIYTAPPGFVMNPETLVPELRAEIERLRAALRTVAATLAMQCFAETITYRTFDDDTPVEPAEAIQLAALALRPNVGAKLETTAAPK